MIEWLTLIAMTVALAYLLWRRHKNMDCPTCTESRSGYRWTVTEGKDHPGDDIISHHKVNVDQMKYICESTPACKAFNYTATTNSASAPGYGYIKTASNVTKDHKDVEFYALQR